MEGASREWKPVGCKKRLKVLKSLYCNILCTCIEQLLHIVAMSVKALVMSWGPAFVCLRRKRSPPRIPARPAQRLLSLVHSWDWPAENFLRFWNKNRWRGLLTRDVCLLHYNARLHRAIRTCLLLEQCKWKIFEHLPYSLDLAPSDYHLFLHLKKFLAGQSLRSDQVTERRYAGLAGRLGGQLSRRRHTKVGPLIWQVP
jgi:hypothetical protein